MNLRKNTLYDFKSLNFSDKVVTSAYFDKHFFHYVIFKISSICNRPTSKKEKLSLVTVIVMNMITAKKLKFPFQVVFFFQKMSFKYN